jgi:chromosome segregation ATPase
MLEEYDKKIKRIQESISAVEDLSKKLVSETESINKKIGIVEVVNKDLSDKIILFENEVESLKSNGKSRILDIEKIKEEQIAALEISKSHLEAANKNSYALASSVAGHKMDMEILRSEFKDLAEKYYDAEKIHTETFANIGAKSAQVEAKLDKIDLRLSGLEGRQSELSYNFQSLKAEISSLHDKMFILEGILMDKLKKNTDEANRSFKEFYCKLDALLVKSDSLDPSHLARIDDLAKYDVKVESNAMDARNANLRSHNTETKVLMLEKRVEQLQLLLNKSQLQG